jgi:hypothetical protein
MISRKQKNDTKENKVVKLDSLLQRIREYIIFLKETGNFTWEDIEKLSGEPASTLRKFCSGKTENIHFDALLNIVSALGGNINDAVSYSQQKEAEVNSVITLKESYEQQIDALIKSLIAISQLISIWLFKLKHILVVCPSAPCNKHRPAETTSTLIRYVFFAMLS